MNDLAPVTSIDTYRASDHFKLQGMLTVREIMTPRDRFLCAIQEETVAQAFAGVPEIYDALPVVEGTDRRDTSAAIVGIIDRRQIRGADMSDQVGNQIDDNAMRPISADLPLIFFVRSLTDERLALVVEPTSDEVVGLVTNYDVARLPVRIALFAALIDLEEDLGDLIRERAGGADDLRRLLSAASEDLRRELDRGINRAGSREGAGDIILEIGFGVKLKLLERLQRCARLEGRHPDLTRIREMRNAIAHGKPFEELLMVPRAARDLEELRKYITRQIGSTT